ncbi:activin receptor type-2A [Periplaneta americana]|uniref:activin receptor type-2A n=1 Tax=Periplaneta americana TaxID=6978 RepID=UPI0037E7EB0E
MGAAGLLVLLLALAHQARSERVCAYRYKEVEHLAIHNADTDESSEDYGAADVQGDSERCKKASNFCYALWKQDANGSSVAFLGQGCWEVSGKQDCHQSECVANKKPPKALNNTKFCCCNEDLCNMNVSDAYVEAAAPATESLEQPPADTLAWLISGLCAGLALVVVVAVLLVYRACHGGAMGVCKLAPDAVHLMENGGPAGLHSGSYALEHLKLASIVGQGRYGSVWKGTVNDQEVAVKIFPSHYRNYFYNERDIYCLPFMDNPALLTYFGYVERESLEGCVEYLLVLSYAPNGCLQDYLRTNLLEWPTFCKMSLSVARGLAHLHTDVRKGDKSKPCVSHRDLNSRNILVKADLSCCLCDLGFAMKISGSKYFQNGEEQHAETKSINDVGTLRYMAPEVLEGAVNLRDCESSLKQIDVYALGLVLWELASRCADLYQTGAETPPYRLPFEAEVGHHPTFEQMQVLVSRHKARPLFPELWRDWSAVKLVRETVEDCWDQDAEARLTALCVEERLQELPSLWERQRGTIYVSGVSPTVNPTFPGSGPRSNNTGSAIVASTLPGDPNRLLLLDSGEDTGCSVRSGSQSSATFGKDTRESTMSEGTVETMVTMSPSEPHLDPSYKNSNHTATIANGYSMAPTIRGALQPYQGRNPCMERNLMLQAPSDEELSCNGNTLVDRSSKHTHSHYTESQSLVSHDYLSMSQGVNNNGLRPATPIPYVQNAVYDTSAYATIPKQPNIPGNGSALGDGKSVSRWGGWGGLRKLLDSKKHLLFGMYRGGNEQTNRMVNVSKDSESEDAKSNLLACQNGLKKSPVIMETQVSLLPSGGMKNGVVTSVMSPLNHNNKSEESNKPAKSRRPSTLPLAKSTTAGSRQSLEEHFQQVFGTSTRMLKDPNSRVKTPGDVPPSVRRMRGKGNSGARFSLYDDRMMTASDYYEPKNKSAKSGSTALSSSVPTDIDISCNRGATLRSVAASSF